MIEAIFFDFDGTICDTQGDIIAAYAKVFEEANLAISADELRIGPPLKECLKQAKPEISAEELNYLTGRFVHYYDKGDFIKTSVYEGIFETLEELKSRGYKLFIATNKRLAPLKLILEKFDLERYFEGLYSSDMLMPERSLSKSEMLSLALQEHGLNSLKTLMIGDTSGDILAGKANKMLTLAVRWGYAIEGELEATDPDFWANRPKDMLSYVN